MSNSAQVFANLRIWDGIADGYLDGVDAIRIEGGVITAMGRRRNLGGRARCATCTASPRFRG